MEDEPGPSGKPSGRGGGARKFAPTVPSRRKKAEDSNGAPPSAAEAAAANEAFQDLIRAAQSESKWERGRGRGFGRGRGGQAPQMVTFGGGEEGRGRPVGRAPQPARRTAAASGDKQQAGSSSAVAKSESKVKVKPDAHTPEGKRELYDAGADAAEDEEVAGPLFDFSQYYPTTLPLSMHHPEDDAADLQVEQQAMRQGVPEDLVQRQDDPEHTAQQLGLTDLSAAQDLLYLFQLPSVLPLAAPPKPDAADAKRRSKPSSSAAVAAAATAASAAAATLAEQQPAAAGIKDLPSGKIGKLLVFHSGKVKLQIGDVLLDVTAGLPVVTRQDVAAVNTTSKHLVQLGPVAQRAVVCPDVWQLMADEPVPNFPRAAAVQQQQQAAAAAGPGTTNGVKSEEEDEEMSEGDEAAAADGTDGMDVDGKQGDTGSEGEAEEEEAAKQQLQQAKAAAAAAAAPADGALGLLGLTAGAVAGTAAAGGRGKGRFMPAARPRASVKKEGR